VPHPKDKELETGHGQLGDLVAIAATTGFLDGTADFFDSLVVLLSKNIEAGDHLVVTKGF
jgi:hypothetical protein